LRAGQPRPRGQMTGTFEDKFLEKPFLVGSS
jgi:hypothetical protein